LETWVPYIKGAAGRCWFEPLVDTVRWKLNGLEIKLAAEHAYGSVSKRVQSEDKYFALGIAFSMIGAEFSARAHRFRSIFGHMGSSVFPSGHRIATLLCQMNSGISRTVLPSLNPGIHFEVGDVNRLPIFPVANADTIFSTLEAAFTEHESHREPSVEFRSPGPSPWRAAQDWAQRAVDRPEGAPLPPYEPQHDPPDPEAAVIVRDRRGAGALRREAAKASSMRRRPTRCPRASCSWGPTTPPRTR
jgi:hypothetical protein